MLGCVLRYLSLHSKINELIMKTSESSFCLLPYNPVSLCLISLRYVCALFHPGDEVLESVVGSDRAVLLLDPVSRSHAGEYVCTAGNYPLNEDTLYAGEQNVTVDVRCK